MKITGKYKFGFDAWALGLFVLVMIPNLFWFGVPAPNDILRTVSVTPVTDTIGAALQVLMIASLCIVKNKNAGKMQLSPLIIGVIACLVAYYTGWCLFYSGIVGKLVIGLLTLPPCIAFVLYAIDRKNLPAILFASGFMLCHVVFGVVNYM